MKLRGVKSVVYRSEILPRTEVLVIWVLGTEVSGHFSEGQGSRQRRILAANV